MPPRNRPRFHPFLFGGITDRITDPTRAFEHEPNPKTRRDQVYGLIDDKPVQVWVVVVAGAGFLTDAYDIFAVNTVLPMISFVYWGGWDEQEAGIPRNISTALLCATLAGSAIGQVTFGVLGDLFGRKKMYGLLLLVILWATLGLAAAADGSNNSMSITGWLFIWRFFMGFAIGGDYPLSATIVSEFAPKLQRSRMLAWLFFMQPLGQFLGTWIAVAVTASFHAEMKDIGSCTNPECFRAVDKAWRWIVGIGGLPALLALIIRLQIPESPRYTMDVLSDWEKAKKDIEGYFFVEDVPRPLQNGNGQPFNHTTSNTFVPGGQSTDCPAGQNGTADLPMDSGRLLEQPSSPTVDAHQQHIIPSSSPIRASILRLRSTATGDNEICESPFTQWRSGFRQYFRKNGNRVHLAGTMTTWFLLDVSFYGLGMSSPATIQKIFNDQTTAKKPVDTTSSVYSILMGNAWHPLIVVSLPALLGGLAMIYVIQHSRPVKVQSLFFVVMAVLLFVVGITFKPLLKTGQGHWGLVALYMFCQFFFNLGPNATTFIIPAEQFKTEYRCTAHGLSAASGKLGSVIGQLIVGLSGAANPSSFFLGYLIIVFGVLMLAGALVTQLAVPDSRDANGEPMSLEDLGLGGERMKDLRSSRWNRWHTVDADPIDGAIAP